MITRKSKKPLQEKLDELEISVDDQAHVAEEIEGEVMALKFLLDKQQVDK